ncbi:hypothetical protein MtrunA17_Chr8g0374421 [Medicago truncatula]|uniref:Uncharacterized protein n=1 Tax=Medicago truncatula TaxID=3880 RepID=A0A396GPY1_MEDTR|nr:hypothetical protein MtrunA17_Chr8g0374421 [Medicago truncatula]
MFLDLVNVVEKIFEISLLQNELSISFHLSLKFFVCSCTWSEEKKMYRLSLIVTSSEDDKFDVFFRVFILQSQVISRYF